MDPLASITQCFRDYTQDYSILPASSRRLSHYIDCKGASLAPIRKTYAAKGSESMELSKRE